MQQENQLTFVKELTNKTFLKPNERKTTIFFFFTTICISIQETYCKMQCLCACVRPCVFCFRDREREYTMLLLTLFDAGHIKDETDRMHNLRN